MSVAWEVQRGVNFGIYKQSNFVYNNKRRARTGIAPISKRTTDYETEQQTHVACWIRILFDLRILASVRHDYPADADEQIRTGSNLVRRNYVLGQRFGIVYVAAVRRLVGQSQHKIRQTYAVYFYRHHMRDCVLYGFDLCGRRSTETNSNRLHANR